MSKGILPWSGTFHSVANRLIRRYAHNLGLDPGFSVLDRGDSADLMDVVRHELKLSQKIATVSEERHVPVYLFALPEYPEAIARFTQRDLSLVCRLGTGVANLVSTLR